MSLARNLANLKPTSAGLIGVEDADTSLTQLFGFKNRIINGSMTISQRGSVNVTAAGGNIYVAADRFNMFNYFGSGQINTAMSTSVVPAGFSSSIGLTVATAVPLSGTTGYIANIAQTIEGFNIADCYNQSITLSFWVRSSITGTYSVAFYNASNPGATSTTRLYVASYTINSANTWEQKTITVNLGAGTASGTWLSDNGVGLNIAWGLGAESNRKGNTYLNTWGTTSSVYEFQSASQVNWASNAGATFYLAGVQVEKGTVATAFDYRSIGTELELCRRYYQFSSGQLAMPYVSTYYTARRRYSGVFSPPMRSSPTMTATFVYDGTGSGASIGANNATSYISITDVSGGGAAALIDSYTANAEL